MEEDLGRLADRRGDGVEVDISNDILAAFIIIVV